MHLPGVEHGFFGVRWIIRGSLIAIISACNLATFTKWTIECEARVVLDDRVHRLHRQQRRMPVHHGFHSRLLLSGNANRDRRDNELDLLNDGRACSSCRSDMVLEERQVPRASNSI